MNKTTELAVRFVLGELEGHVANLRGCLSSDKTPHFENMQLEFEELAMTCKGLHEDEERLHELEAAAEK